jgi:hypothetical protein
MRNESKQPWFDVDRTGLRKLLEDRGIEFAVFELIQNAWDEAGVSRVEVTLKPASKGRAILTVSDDAPEGFKDLRHAYTLFAESAKKTNAEQRGRFNIGEKLVLSLCDHATIKTTKGTVFFDSNGTRSEGRDHTDAGSIFEAKIKLSSEEIEQVTSEVQKLIPPVNITTIFNNVEIAQRAPRHSLQALMDTVLAGSDGTLRRTQRTTAIHCHEPRAGEKAMIYEMGIPVVEHDCAFHCDVQQKVPLTIDRTNVTTRFLRKLRLVVYDATFEHLTTEDANHEWAQTAVEQTDNPEVVNDYMTKRFGELRVSFDMSDREANNRATAAGYTVIPGGAMSGALWDNVKDHEAIKPAGQLFPTHSGEFVPFEASEIDDNMKAVAAYTKELGVLLLGCSISVAFGEQGSNEAACWSDRKIQYNVKNLGRSWFRLHANRLAIDDLIIHEFGHHYASNHLSNDYYDALTRLAAKAMQLGREGRLPK